MRKNKVVLLILAAFFMLIIDVKAVTVTKGQQINGGSEHVFYKTLDNGAVAFCLSGTNVSIGTSCSSDSVSLTTNQKAIINKIIELNFNSGAGSDTDRYKQTEAVLFKYLLGSNSLGYSSEFLQGKVNDATNAVTNNNAIKDSSFAISFNVGSLTFTHDGDYYVSNNFSIVQDATMNGTPTYSVTGATGATIETAAGGQKYVKVPATSITSNTTITVNASAKQKSYKNNYEANTYSCGSGNQNLATYNAGNTTYRTADSSISGVVSGTKLIINKVDSNGNMLAGATIVVTGPNNYSVEFITTEESTVLEDLEFGTYVITETETPEGYTTSKEKTVIISSENQQVNVDIIDELIKVIISKKDVTSKEELPGAHLQIEDAEGNIIKFCEITEENTEGECKWISTDTPYEIEGLPNGKYYLVETLAPEGYVLSTEKIEFEIDGNKAIINVEMENGVEVEVPDTLSGRSALLLAIAMFDIALGVGIITYVRKNKVQE